MTNENFIRRTLELAKSAAEKGNEPFGAILVKDGEIVFEGENKIYTSHDPTYHAEMGLIRDFCEQTGITDLSKYTLYSSCEPCFMCSGAMVWVRLGALVFGAYDTDYCEIRGFTPNDCSKLIFENSPVRPNVTGGVLRDEAKALLADYFAK